MLLCERIFKFKCTSSLNRWHLSKQDPSYYPLPHSCHPSNISRGNWSVCSKTSDKIIKEPPPKWPPLCETSEARDSCLVQCQLWGPSYKGDPQTTFAEWITKTKKGKRGWKTRWKTWHMLHPWGSLHHSFTIHYSSFKHLPSANYWSDSILAGGLKNRAKYYAGPVVQKYIKLKSFLSMFSCKVDNISCLTPMLFNAQHCTDTQKSLLEKNSVEGYHCHFPGMSGPFCLSALSLQWFLTRRFDWKGKNTTQLFYTQKVNVPV